MYFLTYLLKERKLSGENDVKLSLNGELDCRDVLGDEEDTARASQEYSMWDQ